MQMIVGTTRSCKPIRISTSPPAALLMPGMTLADVFDVFCAVTYLRIRERNGWRLVIDEGEVFRRILEQFDLNSVFRDALEDSRRSEPDRTFFDDASTGQNLVLPALRA